MQFCPVAHGFGTQGVVGLVKVKDDAGLLNGLLVDVLNEVLAVLLNGVLLNGVMEDVLLNGVLKVALLEPVEPNPLVVVAELDGQVFC
jgi:hypothetical protein